MSLSKAVAAPLGHYSIRRHLFSALVHLHTCFFLSSLSFSFDNRPLIAHIHNPLHRNNNKLAFIGHYLSPATVTAQVGSLCASDARFTYQTTQSDTHTCYSRQLNSWHLLLHPLLLLLLLSARALTRQSAPHIFLLLFFLQLCHWFPLTLSPLFLSISVFWKVLVCLADYRWLLTMVLGW